MPDYLNLYDYRCRVATMYRERNQNLMSSTWAVPVSQTGFIDETPDLEDRYRLQVLQRFRAAKDDLFAHHPQSALDEEQRKTFRGLHYFPYNPAMCFTVNIDTQVEATSQTVVMNAVETMTMTTVGRMHFTVEDESVTLSLYWLDVYGGGLFLPFRDMTCPAQSYGGGRYLFDTIKGSDFLSATGASSWDRIVLDFNYAYNPSCAYNDRWTCPLAPVENRLNVPIPAGEMKYKL